MKTSLFYREEACKVLNGNWNRSALLMFVFFFISGAVSTVLPAPLGTIVLLPVGYGLMKGFLMQGRGVKVEISNLFDSFNMRVWMTMLLRYIYIFLWSLLLIIPGIVKSYSYAMTEFLLADNPELENNAAIERSMAMMQGQKMRLFLLDLSFIGWVLLALFFTLGIGFLWLCPYMYQARAAFYEDLKKEA